MSEEQKNDSSLDKLVSFLQKLEDNLAANTALVNRLMEDNKDDLAQTKKDLLAMREVFIKLEASLYDIYILTASMKEILLQKNVCTFDELKEVTKNNYEQIIKEYNEASKKSNNVSEQKKENVE